MKRTFSVCAALLMAVSVAYGFDANVISAEQAINHIGNYATVCGKVVSAKYASAARGKPTFLNLDRPYPNQSFTALIWESDRQKFGQPESRYLGQRVCVSGMISSYKGEPEIIVRDRKQLATE